MHLLNKIWHLKPTINTFYEDKFQYISGSNWNLQKKNFEMIKKENKLIGHKVLEQQTEVKEYKKKLKEDIK